MDLWGEININYEPICVCACVVLGIAKPPSGKVALVPKKREKKRKKKKEKKKAEWRWLKMGFPFSFHIHIIDLWIFYTVLATPSSRVYLHL